MADSRLRLLEKIAEAALDDSLWEEVMDDLRAYLSGSHGIIFTSDIDPTSAGALWESKTIGIGDVNQYVEHYHTKDLWTLRGLETGAIETGRTFVGQEIVSEKEFVESEFHQDFMKGLDVKNLITATIFDGKGEIPRVMMSIYADNKSQPYDDDAAQFYRSIVPHIQNSIALRHKFKTFENKAASFEFLFNAIEQPAMLAGHDGAIIGMNRAAEVFLEGTDDIRVAGRLACWCPSDQKNLDAAMHRIIRTNADDAENAFVVAIKNRHDTRPYIVEFRSVPGSRDVHGNAPCALISITAERPPDMARVVAVCAFYDLTKAEMALCLKLLDGYSLIASAELLGVTEGTARQRLKTIFSKTDTHSQAALIGLLKSF